jgi:hypothetical protein
MVGNLRVTVSLGFGYDGDCKKSNKSYRGFVKASSILSKYYKQPMLHTKSSKDDESSGDGVAVGSSKLTRSKKNTRRRQLGPTYNASTPFTRLENTQD